jgi:hypothetical protein
VGFCCRPSSALTEKEGKRRRLRERLHSAAYTVRLGSALQKVKSYLSSRGHRSLEQLASHPKQLDRILEEFVDSCYGEQESRQGTVEAILAVQRHCRVTRQALPCTWEACWSWRMLQPLQTRRPMPPSVLQAMVVVAFALGLSGTGRARTQWFVASVLWRVAFDGLLRPGEMLALTRQSVRLPDDLLSEDLPAVVIIESPKNRRHMGKRQFVLIKDLLTISWLRWICQHLKPAQRLFPGSRATMVKLFRLVNVILGLQDAGLTLASFRTGGATSHFQKEQNLGALQFHGRWRTPVTLQHYLQEALSAYLLLELPSATRAAVAACQAAFVKMTSPPSFGPG